MTGEGEIVRVRELDLTRGPADLDVLEALAALDLTAVPHVAGRHAAWLPDYFRPGWGVKVPWQAGGRVQKYGKPQEPTYPRESVAEELAFVRWLAERAEAPPVGRLVWFAAVVDARHRGAWWADPCGAWGYEQRDARALPPGGFSVGGIRGSGRVDGSPGAWNDLLVPERGNVLNGYLIDVRRSGHDLLRYLGPVPPLPDPPRASREDILRRLRDAGAFPFGARPEPYQDAWLDGAWVRGERRVPERAELLGFRPVPGESVLDLGCHTGGFLQLAFASQRGRPGVLVGVDAQEEYVELARELAGRMGADVCHRAADLVAERARLLPWLTAVFGPCRRGHSDCAGGHPDHLLALSMGKHLGEDVLWWWVDALRARRTYLETNAVKEGVPAPLSEGVWARGGRLVGWSTDRHRRALYRIDTESEGLSWSGFGPRAGDG